MINEGKVREQDNRYDKLAHMRDLVRENIQKAYEVNANRYNLRSRPVTYDVGRIVLRRNFTLSSAPKQFSSKVANFFLKARVRDKIGKSCYILEDMSGKKLGTFHAKDMQAVK